MSNMTFKQRAEPYSVRWADRLRVEAFESRAAMGAAAAYDLADEMRRRLALQPGLRIMFSAAPSQLPLLEALYLEEGIDWARVTAFHVDEYIGLDPQEDARFGRWLDRHLFSKLPFGSIHHLLPGPDPAATAAAYAALLNVAPIDGACLGIGVNGHIAFNDPSVADFDDPLDAKIVDLDEVCRKQQLDDGSFTQIEDVPRRALTLTIPRILRVDRVFCVVPSTTKRIAVRNALHGPISIDCPASILRKQHNCTLYLDRESDPDA
jgi:glucosamine-6-phosphate deaminase